MLNALRKGERGTALVEFAIALPMLVLLLLAGVEFARLILMTQKVQRLSSTMGDLVAQAETLTAGQLDTLLVAAGHVMQPFDHSRDGRVIVSAVGAGSDGVFRVLWQRAGGGAGGMASSIGTPGAPASLPAGFTPAADETVIVAEAFHRFRPSLVGAVLPERTVAERAFNRPRLGSLRSLD